MNPLESCECRVELDDESHFFCRHTAVHANGNVVNQTICRYCRFRTVACEDPRPVPADLKREKLQLPSVATRVFNFSQAVAAFVSDGLRQVDAETYRRRMSVCESCEFRSENHCAKCGCRLTLKAAGRVFKCPIGRWDEDTNEPNTH